MNKNTKKPPKGGNQPSWNFKPCRYKKTIIKKNQYRILPNGDIEIMTRQDTIGFKATKRKPRKPGNGGGSNGPRESKYVTKDDFKILRDDFKDLKSILLELVSKVDSLDKDMTYVKDVLKRNNLK